MMDWTMRWMAGSEMGLSSKLATQERVLKPRLQRLQQRRLCGVTMGLGRQAIDAVSLSVLPAVQVVFEVAVIALQQAQVDGPLRSRPPALGVGLGECPTHDVPALINDAAIGQMKHRHGGLGRQGEQAGRLVAQADLHRLERPPSLQKCHASAHGVRAATKGVPLW